MTRKLRPLRTLARSRAPLVAACILGAALIADLSDRAARAQQDGDAPAAEIVTPTTADATNELFTTATTCALCHTATSRSTALRSADGRDVSPDHTWRGTMMANAFRDPYWRAKVEHELSAAPPEEHAALQALCLGCHGPMAARSATMLDGDVPTVARAADDPLAADGVSCTVCHQIEDEGLGTEASYTAGFVVERDRRAYGPYDDPFAMPMERHSGYVPMPSAHIAESALCGSCHTVRTRSSADAPLFLEQAPYLEWRNSVFSDEGGRTATSRTCRDCHMPDAGTLRIAHNPMGRDFPRVAPREHVRSHAIAGANTLVLGMLDEHWEPLGLVATPEQTAAAVAATRATLAEAATVEVGALRRSADAVSFDVTVTNLTGHKLPTSYPARRAWLRVQVVAGRRVVFDSGAFDDEGRIVGPPDESAVPHRDRIDDEKQVVIYEARGVDGDGRPTFLLREMDAFAKDTRLLPRGWSIRGPDATRTAPVGVGEDSDFTGGSDTVTYDVALPAGAEGLTVHASLLYQSVPPAWVRPLRGLDTPYARAFVVMYDDADRSPEVLASATVRE